MDDRIDRDDNALLKVTWQAKRDALGAVVNDDRDPVAMRRALWRTLQQDMSLGQYVKVQAGINAFAWTVEDLDSL